MTVTINFCIDSDTIFAAGFWIGNDMIFAADFRIGSYIIFLLLISESMVAGCTDESMPFVKPDGSYLWPNHTRKN
jgi:hypothetical protein